MLILVLGCAAPSDSGADPCAPGDEPTLELGTGELAFTPVEGDAPVLELVHGPQGGFHVVVAFQATHFLEDAQAVLEGSIDGEVLAQSSPYVTLRCNAEVGAQQAWGSLLIWDSVPEELDGKQAHVEATLSDADGRSATATLDFLICDPEIGEW